MTGFGIRVRCPSCSREVGVYVKAGALHVRHHGPRHGLECRGSTKLARPAAVPP